MQIDQSELDRHMERAAETLRELSRQIERKKPILEVRLSLGMPLEDEEFGSAEDTLPERACGGCEWL